VSIAQLLVVLLVALIVIGPKRLPEMAYWLGRALQGFNVLKAQFLAQLDQQAKLAELKHNEARANAAELNSQPRSEKETL